MLDISIIETIVEEQLAELKFLATQNFCARREESEVNLNSKLAQVAIGVRRSGKSVLCYNALTKANINFAYVNFDDERFYGIKPDDLNNVLLVLNKFYGDFKYLFIDEPQDVEGWHLFVNRLLRRGMHVVITGSNAKLLSGELATHLNGRSIEIPLYPFSFKEFCEYHKVDVKSKATASKAARLAMFDEYLRKGGFPELLTETRVFEYVNSLVSKIINNDIVRRNKIKYKATLETMINHILNIVPAEIVYDDLAELFKIKSHHTVENYIDYAEKAFLISICKRWSPKSTLRVGCRKAYPIDVALMNNRDDAFVGKNLGFRLESIVYIELLRRTKLLNQSVFFLKERSGEADFVVCEGNSVVEVIQVSYDISSSNTRKREINGLILGAKVTKCPKLTLITRHNQETLVESGHEIHIVPAYDWLVDC
ncbi:MAG: ATP-binding protein [Muribaculaceae bacterium]|nr:ATP-binding protein [Muribaculaceae bacterium]